MEILNDLTEIQRSKADSVCVCIGGQPGKTMGDA